MNYLKTFGLGALLWLIMYAGISAVMPWYSGFVIVRVLVLLVAAGLAYYFASISKTITYSSALTAGVMWVVTGLVLDALITRQFNANIFSSGWLWAGYAATFIMPMVYAAAIPATAKEESWSDKRLIRH